MLTFNAYFTLCKQRLLKRDANIINFCLKTKKTPNFYTFTFLLVCLNFYYQVCPGVGMVYKCA